MKTLSTINQSIYIAP